MRRRALLFALIVQTISAQNVSSAVWVTTHGQPKSGTTWLEVIIDEVVLAAGGSMNAMRKATLGDFHLRNPTHKHRLPGAKGNASKVSVSIRRSYEFISDCVKADTQIWSEACIKRDAFLDVLPPKNRYIIILRDPRAVVLSWNHYIGQPPTRSYLKLTSQCAAVVSVRYYWHEVLVCV